jgi:hypothetical protein
MRSVNVKRSAGLIVMIGTIGLLASTVHADDSPPVSATRKVAVIEYRAGSAALPAIATNIAAVLKSHTGLTVLSPDQTQAVYGDGLDQAIVKCAGANQCIAAIGKRVGVAEMLLVGVSEFGGVILTMQRIDVASEQVTSRVAESISNSAGPSNDEMIGFAVRLLPPSDFLRFGSIAIIANVSGAQVTVGGKVRGLTPVSVLAVTAPAKYDIRVEKSGYVPFSASVQVPPEGAVRVSAELSLRSTGSRWYQKWWVLAGAGVLVAGTTAAVVYSTRSSSSSPGMVAVTGTIE